MPNVRAYHEVLAEDPRAEEITRKGERVLKLLQHGAVDVSVDIRKVCHGGDATLDLARVRAEDGDIPELVHEVIAEMERTPSLGPAKAWDVVRAARYGLPREW
jgi:hypothetical protein